MAIFVCILRPARKLFRILFSSFAVDPSPSSKACWGCFSALLPPKEERGNPRRTKRGETKNLWRCPTSNTHFRKLAQRKKGKIEASRKIHHLFRVRAVWEILDLFLYFLRKKEETEKERTISFNYGKKKRRVKKIVFATFSDNTDSGNSLLSSSQLLNPASSFFSILSDESRLPVSLSQFNVLLYFPFFPRFSKKRKDGINFHRLEIDQVLFLKKLCYFPGIYYIRITCKQCQIFFCGKSPPFQCSKNNQTAVE